MSISLVQQASGAWSSGPTFVVTLGSSPSGSNILVLCCGGDPKSNTISSISGGTWTKIASSGTDEEVEIWIGTSPSSTTITLTLSGTPNSKYANVQEWSGLSSTTDGSTTNFSAVSNNPATGNISTTNTNDVLIAVSFFAGTSPTLSSGPTNSFTSLSNPSSGAFQAAYRIVNSTGTYSTDWTYGGLSFGWDAAMIALQAASAPSALPSAGIFPRQASNRASTY